MVKQYLLEVCEVYIMLSITAGGNEQNNDPTHAGTPRNSDCTVAKYDEVNLPSAENVESFYHLLESGHHVNGKNILHVVLAEWLIRIFTNPY